MKSVWDPPQSWTFSRHVWHLHLRCKVSERRLKKLIAEIKKDRRKYE